MSDVDPNTARVIAWLESELGGRVVQVERQPRWRPVWFVEFERGLLPNCVPALHTALHHRHQEHAAKELPRSQS